MDRRENLRRSAAALRGKMRGRTYLHIQSRGLQAVGAGRSARENMRALRISGDVAGFAQRGLFAGRRFTGRWLMAAQGCKISCGTLASVASPNGPGGTRWKVLLTNAPASS